jgi:hypothetical protein
MAMARRLFHCWKAVSNGNELGGQVSQVIPITPIVPIVPILRKELFAGIVDKIVGKIGVNKCARWICSTLDAQGRPLRILCEILWIQVTIGSISVAPTAKGNVRIFQEVCWSYKF